MTRPLTSSTLSDYADLSHAEWSALVRLAQYLGVEVPSYESRRTRRILARRIEAAMRSTAKL